MSEYRSTSPNEGSEYYGQSIGLPLEETLQTIRFLSKVKASGKFRHELTTDVRENDGTIDAWAGSYLNEMDVKKNGHGSTVEVELHDETQGTIWLDIDEYNIMMGGIPKVEIAHGNNYYSHKNDESRPHHNNQYRHEFGEKYAMRAAELVLRLANKRFAALGQDIVQHNAKHAEKKLQRRLAREQDAAAHFEEVLASE